MGGGTMPATVRKLSDMDPYARKCAALEKDYEVEEDSVLELTGLLREKKQSLQRLRDENSFLQERLAWFENRSSTDHDTQMELREGEDGAGMPNDTASPPSNERSAKQLLVTTSSKDDDSGILIMHNSMHAASLSLTTARTDMGCRILPGTGISASPSGGQFHPSDWHQ